MEEEEVLGVNLDELSNLFSDSGFIGERSFGWGLAPYSNIVLNEDGSMTPSGSVTLYIDAFGEANLNSKMWFFQKTDPIDAYDEPEFSKSNLFIRGLAKAIPGVPPYGIIALPWYEVDNARGGLIEIEFPDDTPEGFVPCSGYTIEIGGQEFKLPNLTSRTGTSGRPGEIDPETTYFAPPGCTYMMRLPDGLSTQGLSGQTDSFIETFVEFRGKLKTWGNPANPFDNGLL